MATNRGCKNGQLYHAGTYSWIPVSVCVSDDYYSVYCTMLASESSTLDPYHDVKARLQRYVSAGYWETIDSWSGRIYNRTSKNIAFNNIASKNASTRVVVTAEASGSGTIYSPSWVR